VLSSDGVVAIANMLSTHGWMQKCYVMHSWPLDWITIMHYMVVILHPQ